MLPAVERVADADPMGTGGWDEAFATMPAGWRDKDYRLLSWVVRMRRLSGTLLDVGCAVGDGFPVLRRAAPSLTEIEGCDFSAEGVAVARSRFPDIGVFQHDLRDAFPRTWDNVVCLQTVEHLEDPALAVRHLSAAAKRALIVATPYRNRRHDRDHRWSFDEHDFRDVFDGYVLDRRELNIFWYRSPDRRLMRSRPSSIAAEGRERLWRRLGRAPGSDSRHD